MMGKAYYDVYVWIERSWTGHLVSFCTDSFSLDEKFPVGLSNPKCQTFGDTFLVYFHQGIAKKLLTSHNIELQLWIDFTLVIFINRFVNIVVINHIKIWKCLINDVFNFNRFPQNLKKERKITKWSDAKIAFLILVLSFFPLPST